MKAIYSYVNKRKTFIGKHIGNTIVREFSFNKAVLWQNDALGFDKKLLKYAEDSGIKSFIFSDPAKRVRLSIGIKSAINNGTDGEYGQGGQWYIPKSIMKKLEGYKKTPYVRQEVVL